MALTTPLFLPLLLLYPFASPALSTITVRNCSSRLHLNDPTSVVVDWILPDPQRNGLNCQFEINFPYTVKMKISSYNRDNSAYNPTSQCSPYTSVSIWNCIAGCRGLFYARSRYSERPQLVTSLLRPLEIKSSFLRLLYCHGWPRHGVPYSTVEFVIEAREILTGGTYQDPVWRVLGPVLATVCMVATVFLVCVCYVQHAYQRRQPLCCRWLSDRLRGPPTAEANAAANASGGTGPVSALHRHVDPMTDQPPAYDDFRKYHRPCSFGEADRPRPPPGPPVPVPPSYAEAVQSLEREEEEQRARAQERARHSVRRSLSCGANNNNDNSNNTAATEAPGVDNPAFLREENAPPAFSSVSRREEPRRPGRRGPVNVDDIAIDVDLGDGHNAVVEEPRASSC